MQKALGALCRKLPVEGTQKYLGGGSNASTPQIIGWLINLRSTSAYCLVVRFADERLLTGRTSVKALGLAGAHHLAGRLGSDATVRGGTPGGPGRGARAPDPSGAVRSPALRSGRGRHW